MITYEIKILFRDPMDGSLPVTTFDLVEALRKGGLEVEEGIPAIVVWKQKPL